MTPASEGGSGMAASAEFRGAGRGVALVRGELMHRAFENVIRNAVKHTAAGTCTWR